VARTFVLPRLLGTDWDHPRQAAAAWAGIRGNEFAKAGVDVAVWSLWAGAQGLSLAAALGGTRGSVVAGVSLGIEPTIDDLLEQVRLQTEAGYPRVKLKIAPGWDVEPVREVRAAFGDLDLHVDANGIYTESDDHLAALTALDDHGLTMIEQPFAPRNLLAHARLQERIATPVCLDESVETLDDLHTAITLKALRVLNIKVSRMGGLTPAVAAHDLAGAEGIPVWCGGMHEFGIGRAANIAISSLPGFSLPSDVSASAKYYARDIIVPAVVADHGVVQVPHSPGLGYRVDEGFIAENTLDTVEL
jgi:O-succinylbenzoate synthase